MENTRHDLEKLVKYLVNEHGMTPELLDLGLERSRTQDKHHDRSPRAFCHVEKDKWTIFCTGAMEEIPGTVRIGVLLHEIGHLVLDAFDSELPDGEEVEVDSWIVLMIPEAGYTYTECEHTWRGKIVDALNVQTVSEDFLRRIRNVR